MKQSMKRGVTVLVGICLLLALLPVIPAKAGTYQGLQYVVSNGEVTVESCSSSVSGDVVLPETIDGYPVTKIAAMCFSGRYGITSITIPDSVTVIESFAFEQCSGLKAVVIGDGVTQIHNYAFVDCPNLTSVTVGQSVRTIGEGAFSEGAIDRLQIYFCGDAPEFGSNVFFSGDEYYSAAVKAYYFSHTSGWTSSVKQNYGGLVTWKECKRYENLIYEVVIDPWATLEGITYVNILGRVGSSPVVTIPDKIDQIEVTTIEKRAFENNPVLTQITIPASMTQIKEESFSGCSNLSNISFLGGRLTFEGEVFSGVTANVCYPVNNSSWTEFHRANYGGTLTWRVHTNTSSYGDNVSCTEDTVIAAQCDYCGNTTTVLRTAAGHQIVDGSCTMCDLDVMDVLTYRVSEGAVTITGCDVSLVGALSIPDTIEGYPVVAIDANAFNSCTGLTAVTVPEGVIKIGSFAFSGCTGLKTFTIPEGIVKTGDNMFYQCTGLTSVTLPESLTGIEEGTFRECRSLEAVNIPAGVTEIGMFAFYGCSSLSSVIIPQGVTELEMDTFGKCSSLSSVTFLGDVTKIGSYAFEGCGSLRSITLPESVIDIGDYAFQECYSLKTVAFSGSACTIGPMAFDLVTANVCYPSDDPTWTQEVQQNYGGTLTWQCHNYENGVCVICGEAEPDNQQPVVVPTLTLKTPALEFKDVVKIIAFFTAENTEDVVEMGMITYAEPVDVIDISTADYVIPGAEYEAVSDRYYAGSQGIFPKYLADTLYLACYAKLSDGSYVYTKLAPYSPLQYATNQLNNSADMKVKQLVAAMLNYSAAAQEHFGYNIENLANAGLTEELRSLPESYHEGMVNTVPKASDDKVGVFANNKGFSKRSPAVSFEGAFSINYFFTPAYTPVDGITLYYWYESDYAAAEVLTAENATGSMEVVLTDNGQYRADIEGIAAKNLDQAIYVAAVYNDADGNTWTSGVLGYSIGAYCYSQSAQGGTIADLAKATAVYGYHAKQYFTN